jgi:hypothetical protein
VSLQCYDIFLCNTCCMYSMLNGVVDSRHVRAEKVVTSSQSTGAGVASSLASRRSNNWRRLWGSEMKSRGSEIKCRGRNMKPWDNMTTTIPRPSPSNSFSFKLVNYFIRYRVHINTFKTNCIATCIVNGAAVRNSVAAVATSPPLPPFRQPLQAPVHFLSLDF